MKHPQSPSIGRKTEALSHGAGWLWVGLLLLFIIVVRARLIDVPLERDEGEYAYMGQLLLQGVPPYSLAYNMKLPGSYVAYALLMSLFGQTIHGIHLGFMVLNCTTVILIYLFVRKLTDNLAGVAAAGAYGVLSLGSSVLGFAAHATHLVSLFAVGGALLLLHALQSNARSWYFFSGTAFGLAFLMKQPGVFFVLFGVFSILHQYLTSGLGGLSRGRLFHLPVFSVAALLPLLVSVTSLYAAGVFDTFWFWTVQYAAEYGSQVPLSRAFALFRSNLIDVIDGFLPIWFISGLGSLVVLLHRELNEKRMYIVLFMVASFLSICPGFYFREHYFVTLLPAVALSAGIFVNYFNTVCVSSLRSSWSRFVAPGLFLAVILAGMVHQKEYFFQDAPVTISRKLYGNNPFPESVEIARFVAQRSSPNDKIAVFGSEPQIYFYSKRTSATGYIYTYGLFENHDYRFSMQREMTREVESTKPKFIIWVNVFTSWLVQPEPDMYLFSWLQDYLDNGYTLVGIADILPSGVTIYRWHDDAADYYSSGTTAIDVLVFERSG